MAVGFEIPAKKSGKAIQRDSVSAPPHKRLLRPDKHENYKANAAEWRRRRRNISSSTFKVKDMERAVRAPVCETLRQAYIDAARRHHAPFKPQP